MTHRKKDGELQEKTLGSAQSVENLEKMLREWEARNKKMEASYFTRDENGKSWADTRKTHTVYARLRTGHYVIGDYINGKKYVWYPNPSEVRDCCKTITLPNLKFPYTLIDHCRTLKHCAMLFGIDPKIAKSNKVKMWWELRKAAENA